MENAALRTTAPARGLAVKVSAVLHMTVLAEVENVVHHMTALVVAGNVDLHMIVPVPK